VPETRVGRAALLAVVLLATAVGSPALAQTVGVAVGVIIDIPPEVTVGQRNVSGRLVITNQTAGPTPVRVNQIGYDPACRTLSLPCDAPDVGVFVLAGTAVGTAGACTGMPFVVGNLGDGRYTFVAQGTGVELQPSGSPNSSCTIAFTFDVMRLPTAATQPPPATGLTRAVATVVAQQGTQGSTNFGTANITVRSASVYHPLVPERILDTRIGIGGLAGAAGPGATVRLQVTGRGGVPEAGVTAVAMNVAVTLPTGAGFLTLYPAGTPRPLAANLNFTPGKTVPNLVVVKLGAGGGVDIFNSAGSTHVVADIAGWFSDGVTQREGRFQSLSPARILDTRTGTGGPAVRLGPGGSLELQVAGQGGVPVTGAEAVVMNVAVTNTTAQSYLTVHPAGQPQPLASNLNWAPGETVSNRVIAKLGDGGRVRIYNNAGDADLVVDVNGWFTDTLVDAGRPYVPLTPARILDTRDGTGGVIGQRPAGSAVEIQVTGRGSVPASEVSAVVLNVTAVTPAGPGYLTIFPSGSPLPVVSDLNYAAGEIRPNLVVVKVGAGGKVTLYTPTAVDVVFDVAGYFT
jgi:hypothetical protein